MLLRPQHVITDMPRREEQHPQLALPPLQETLYASYFRSEEVEAAMRERFGGGGSGGRRGAPSAAAVRAVNNVTMELRKCAIHPFLCAKLSEQLWLVAVEHRNAAAYGRSAFAWWADSARADFDVSDLLASAEAADRELYWRLFSLCSAKAQWLADTLPALRSEGHRVLLFSQFTSALDLLEPFLEARGFRFERLDGSTPLTQRQAAINRFNAPLAAAETAGPNGQAGAAADPRPFIFLISTRAGGLGINLQSADTVILLDSDFNPLNDAQAVARAHRLGQTRAVRVFRPFVAGTYEEALFSKADRKLGAAMVFRISNAAPAQSAAAAAAAEEGDPLESLLELRAANLDTGGAAAEGDGPDLMAFISQGFWRSMREDAGLAALPEVAAMITAVSGSQFDPGQLSGEQQAVVAAAMKRLADVRAATSAAGVEEDDGGMSKTRSGGVRLRVTASADQDDEFTVARRQSNEVVNEDELPEAAADDFAVDVDGDDAAAAADAAPATPEQLSLAQLRRLVAGLALFGAGPSLASWAFLRDWVLGLAEDRAQWLGATFAASGSASGPRRALSIATVIEATRAVVASSLAAVPDVGERTTLEAQVCLRVQKGWLGER